VPVVFAALNFLQGEGLGLMSITGPSLAHVFPRALSASSWRSCKVREFHTRNEKEEINE